MSRSLMDVTIGSHAPSVQAVVVERDPLPGIFAAMPDDPVHLAVDENTHAPQK